MLLLDAPLESGGDVPGSGITTQDISAGPGKDPAVFLPPLGARGVRNRAFRERGRFGRLRSLPRKYRIRWSGRAPGIAKLPLGFRGKTERLGPRGRTQEAKLELGDPRGRAVWAMEGAEAAARREGRAASPFGVRRQRRRFGSRKRAAGRGAAWIIPGKSGVAASLCHRTPYNRRTRQGRAGAPATSDA